MSNDVREQSRVRIRYEGGTSTTTSRCAPAATAAPARTTSLPCSAQSACQNMKRKEKKRKEKKNRDMGGRVPPEWRATPARNLPNPRAPLFWGGAGGAQRLHRDAIRGVQERVQFLEPLGLTPRCCHRPAQHVGGQALHPSQRRGVLQPSPFPTLPRPAPRLQLLPRSPASAAAPAPRPQRAAPVRWLKAGRWPCASGVARSPQSTRLRARRSGHRHEPGRTRT